MEGTSARQSADAVYDEGKKLSRFAHNVIAASQGTAPTTQAQLVFAPHAVTQKRAGIPITNGAWKLLLTLSAISGKRCSRAAVGFATQPLCPGNYLLECREQGPHAAVAKVKGRQRQAVAQHQHDVLPSPFGRVLADRLHQKR